MLYSATSGLHCLPVTLFGDSRLKWLNSTLILNNRTQHFAIKSFSFFCFSGLQSDLVFSVLNELEQLPRPALVAQLNAHLTGDQEGADSTPLCWHYFYMEIDHKIFSMVILSILLIQEG